MSSIVVLIFIILSVLEVVFEINKKQQKNVSKKTIVDNSKIEVHKENVNVIEKKDFNYEYAEVQNEQEKNKKTRVIVDRESEILNNNLEISKDNLVTDIIFAEILKKPKSKR